MNVQVISSVNEACSTSFLHKTAIVIDALRATSTIAAALAAGAASVLPAETVMDARAVKRSDDVLGGERFCRKIAGFDLGNSPSEYTETAVGGKRVVLTTTNGTRALHKSMRADYVMAASFLNAEACARYAVELRRDVVVLCAGSHDEFAVEDGLCAGLLLHEWRTIGGISAEPDDFGLAMLSLYRDRSNRIYETLLESSSGRRLVKLGMKEDVAFCSQLNIWDIVPLLSGEELIRR